MDLHKSRSENPPSPTRKPRYVAGVAALLSFLFGLVARCIFYVQRTGSLPEYARSGPLRHVSSVSASACTRTRMSKMMIVRLPIPSHLLYAPTTQHNRNYTHSSVMDMFKILEDPPSEDEEESAVASVNEVTSLNKSSSTREQNDVAAPSLAAWPGLARDTRRSDGHYIRSDVDRGRGAAPAAALEDFMLVLKRELNVEGEMAEFADVLRQ